MTPDRFAALADIYGSRLDRWPAGERAEALAFREERPAEARELLREAAVLDAALDRWTVPGPGAVLAGRVATAMSRHRSYRRRLRLWLSGMGAATVLAGGIAAGISVVAMPPPAPEQDPLYTLSVLGQPLDEAEVPAVAGAPAIQGHP